MQKMSAYSRSEWVSRRPSIYSTNTTSRRLLQKSVTLWESFPPQLRYDPTWHQDVGFLVYLQLENLYTEFLLQKLIVNQDHTSRGALIQTSHQILSLVLSVLNKKSVTYRSKVDLEWSVCKPLSYVKRVQTDSVYSWSITRCRAPVF
jgi:hypothetical protein